MLQSVPEVETFEEVTQKAQYQQPDDQEDDADDDDRDARVNDSDDHQYGAGDREDQSEKGR